MEQCSGDKFKGVDILLTSEWPRKGFDNFTQAPVCVMIHVHRGIIAGNFEVSNFRGIFTDSRIPKPHQIILFSGGLKFGGFLIFLEACQSAKIAKINTLENFRLYDVIIIYL